MPKKSNKSRSRNNRNGRKQTMQQMYQSTLNEMEDIRNDEMRDLLNLNYRINCKFRNKKQKDMAQVIKDNRIIFVSGPAGCGKTFVALKTGLELIKNSEVPIENIVLTIPIVGVGKDLGYLPGDLEMKINNYFQHFYSNIDKIVGKSVTSFLSESGLVSKKVMGFVRGDTFGKYDENGKPIGEFCILDEAQNMTVHEMKTFISRIGENSKIIVLFDPGQIDIKLRDHETNGASDAQNRLSGIDGVGVIEFTEDEIVRDPFLKEIMKAYKD